MSDCSSISSTDPRDIEILISGEHPHFFDAKNTLKKMFSQDKQQRAEQKSWYFNCRKRMKLSCKKGKQEDEEEMTADSKKMLNGLQVSLVSRLDE